MPTKAEPRTLDEALQAKDWSQHDLANAIGVDASLVSKWSRREVMPRLVNANKAAHALGITTNLLERLTRPTGKAA